MVRSSLRDLVKGKEGKETKAEDETIYPVYVRYAYTIKESVEHSGLHYATVS